MALINLKEMSCQQPFDLMSVKTGNSEFTNYLSQLVQCQQVIFKSGTVVGQGGRRMANWIVLAKKTTERSFTVQIPTERVTSSRCRPFCYNHVPHRNMEGLGTKRKAIHE